MENFKRGYRLRYTFKADHRTYSTVITAESEEAAEKMGEEYARAMAGTMGREFATSMTERLQTI